MIRKGLLFEENISSTVYEIATENKNTLQQL